MADEQRFEVLLIPEQDGGSTVFVPDLPDVVTEGDTRDQALAMARDAIEGYPDTMRDHGWSLRTAEREHVVIRSA